MLKFAVINQRLIRTDSFYPVEKSKAYLLAHFDFQTSDWDEAEKTAKFKNPSTGEIHDAILDEDHCVVPWEAISDSGWVEASVHGINGAYRITTDIEKFLLRKTLYGGSSSMDPTPTVYEQLLTKLASKAESIGIEGDKLVLKSGDKVVSEETIEAIDGGTFDDWRE